MNDNYLLTSLPPFKYSSDVEIKSTYRVQITLLILRGLSSEKGKKKSFVVLGFFWVKRSEKNTPTPFNELWNYDSADGFYWRKLCMCI